MKNWITNSLWVTLSVFSLTSCGPNKAEQQTKEKDALAKEVLDIHDEVMPKMGEIVKLRKEIKGKINKWTETPDTAPADSLSTATNLVNQLEQADKGMMEWMHEYNGGQGLYEHNLVMEYLGEEKVKVTKVKEDMESAIEAGRTFLGK